MREWASGADRLDAADRGVDGHQSRRRASRLRIDEFNPVGECACALSVLVRVLGHGMRGTLEHMDDGARKEQDEGVSDGA